MIRAVELEGVSESSVQGSVNTVSPRVRYAELVDRALGLASECIDRTLEVSAIAQSLNVSSRTLERAFRSQQGTTVRDAIGLLRMRAACRLLAETSDSVNSVAIRAGYCSASKMCDVFRVRLKQTPRQYRMAMRQ